jgi:hypothetical protein
MKAGIGGREESAAPGSCGDTDASEATCMRRCSRVPTADPTHHVPAASARAPSHSEYTNRSGSHVNWKRKRSAATVWPSVRNDSRRSGTRRKLTMASPEAGRACRRRAWPQLSSCSAKARNPMLAGAAATAGGVALAARSGGEWAAGMAVPPAADEVRRGLAGDACDSRRSARSPQPAGGPPRLRSVTASGKTASAA